MMHQKGVLKRAGNGYRIIASNEAPDRDGEIIKLSAWKNLKDYLETNPVILWAHDYARPPVGKATGGKITDEALELDIEFAPTEFGQEVKSLYDGGFLNSFSVGFMPKRQEGKTFVEAELLEVSAVPVPANPTANLIRAAEASGLRIKALKESDTLEDEDEETVESPTVRRLLELDKQREDSDETTLQREIDALAMVAEMVPAIKEERLRREMRAAARTSLSRLGAPDE